MRIERIYDEPTGGTHILVDRLWPRGMSKAAAVLDVWAKELAPSHELRKEFHAGMTYEEFRARYLEELDGADLSILEGDDVVLLTAAASRPNHADVLVEAASRQPRP